MARIIQAAWLALTALMLSGCAAEEDKASDYRYRLTVEVETPQGLRSGSSVIEVEQSIGRTTMGDGVDAPRRHLCAIVEVLPHH